MLSAQADSSMQALESVQDSLLEGMRASSLVGEEQFAAAMRTAEVQRMLHDRVHALRFVNAVAVLDQGGMLLNVSRVWPPPAVSFADRDYYKVLAGSPGHDRFVSEPVLNRVSGDWSFYLARRFDRPDGRLLGVVLGAVNLAYFQQFFEEVAPGSDASVSLYREDGQMLVRHPWADPFSGAGSAHGGREVDRGVGAWGAADHEPDRWAGPTGRGATAGAFPDRVDCDPDGGCSAWVVAGAGARLCSCGDADRSWARVPCCPRQPASQARQAFG